MSDQTICRRCYRTVDASRGKPKTHKCSHGQTCRTAASPGWPDKPACSSCESEAVDACGFSPSGPFP